MAKKTKYRLILPNDVASLMKKLHPDIKKNIKQALKEILEDPYSGKPLQDELKGLITFRVNKFRIVYRMEGKTIQIVAVGPRAVIYEVTLMLIKSKAKSKT